MCGCLLKNRSPIFSWVGYTPAVRFTGSGTRFAGGFAVGSSTDIKYLFLEVHYRNSLASPDYSTGLDLNITRSQPYYNLMIFVVMGIGTIPKNTNEVFIDACVQIPYFTNNYGRIFSMQPHTHGMGRLVSTFFIGSKGGSSEVYRANPLWPQAYYGGMGTSINAIQIYGNENIYTRCKFTSAGVNFDVNTNGMGPSTQWSEMCIANLVVAATGSFTTTKNAFLRGGCSDSQKDTITSLSNPVFGNIPQLDLHAMYGNYTGVVPIDSTHSINLSLETFKTFLDNY